MLVPVRVRVLRRDAETCGLANPWLEQVPVRPKECLVIEGGGNEALHQRIHRQDIKCRARPAIDRTRSEEHTSELQSLMRNSYAVFCLKKKLNYNHTTSIHIDVYY